MGSFSIVHWLAIALPLLALAAIVVLVVLIVRWLRPNTDGSIAPTVVVTPAADPGRIAGPSLVNTPWLAAAGYMFVLADAYLTHLMGFYQFYVFGILVCLPTLIPFILFVQINSPPTQPLIAVHRRAAIRLYGIYLVWSVLDGVFLSGIGRGLILTVLGIGLSLCMTGVLVWLSLRCMQGIIEVFKIETPRTIVLESGESARADEGETD